MAKKPCKAQGSQTDHYPPHLPHFGFVLHWGPLLYLFLHCHIEFLGHLDTDLCHDSHDSCHDCHEKTQPLNDHETQYDSAESDREEDLSEGQRKNEASEESSDQFEGQKDSMEKSEGNEDDNEAQGQEISYLMEHEVTHESHDKDEKACDFTKDQGTLITPLTCTYHKGKRDVFAASKRKRTISPTAIKQKDDGKENMEKCEQQVKVRRSKRIKNTS